MQLKTVYDRRMFVLVMVIAAMVGILTFSIASIPSAPAPAPPTGLRIVVEGGK